MANLIDDLLNISEEVLARLEDLVVAVPEYEDQTIETATKFRAVVERIKNEGLCVH